MHQKLSQFELQTQHRMIKTLDFVTQKQYARFSKVHGLNWNIIIGVVPKTIGYFYDSIEFLSLTFAPYCKATSSVPVVRLLIVRVIELN